MQRGKRNLGLLIAGLAVVATTWLIPVTGEAGIKLYSAKKVKTTFKSGGNAVEVWEYVPAKGNPPFPGVLALYGLDGIDDEFKKTALMYDMVCGKVADEGFVVQFVQYFDRTKNAIPANQIPQLKLDLQNLLIDNKNPPNPKIIAHYREWMDTVDDGLIHLAADPNVDKNRLGIVGVSMGGFLSTSLLVEKAHPNVKGVVNVFGALPPQQFADIRKNTLPPILLMGGEEDQLVPEKLVRDLLERLRTTDNRGAEAHFFASGHVFYDKKRNAFDTERAFTDALPIVIRFLKRNVQAK